MDPDTPTSRLQSLGQSLWLDNITRALLDAGALRHYIDKMSVTGLTSNPSIFNKAIGEGSDYDADIARGAAAGRQPEALFFDLALDDLRRAAELFDPVYRRSHGVDGYVSLELSPRLAYDTAGSIDAARELHRRADRPNLYIKIPGTREGLPAIEESIFAGVPINVTLLFSAGQYRAAAEAWLRGIERRIDAGLSPFVSSVASVFVSRWDVAVGDKVPPDLGNRLGIAVAQQSYRAYDELLASPRWRRAMNAGAPVQRLLLASTGTKDPLASPTLYVEALAAPLTINTLPQKTLEVFAAQGTLGAPMPRDGGDCDAVLARFVAAGVDIDALAAQLQREGAQAFVDSWDQLLGVIASKSQAARDLWS